MNHEELKDKMDLAREAARRYCAHHDPGGMITVSNTAHVQLAQDGAAFVEVTLFVTEETIEEAAEYRRRLAARLLTNK